MSNKITPKQTLIMWCLLAKNREVLQGEIIPEIKKADREALVALGYITSEKLNRAYILKVEDKGWHWASEHLCDELPRSFKVLQDWLTRVHHQLERNSQTLAEFIGPPSEPPAKSIPNKSRQRPRESRLKSKKLSAAQLRQRIEEAYLALTNGRKAESVPLSKVRTQLADLDRATVDAGLLRIVQGDKQGNQKARLGQISDPKALLQEERDAAFSPGGEPFHLLWIKP
jgi:hypothetical protein